MERWEIKVYCSDRTQNDRENIIKASNWAKDVREPIYIATDLISAYIYPKGWTGVHERDLKEEVDNANTIAYEQPKQEEIHLHKTEDGIYIVPGMKIYRATLFPPEIKEFLVYSIEEKEWFEGDCTSHSFAPGYGHLFATEKNACIYKLNFMIEEQIKLAKKIGGMSNDRSESN